MSNPIGWCDKTINVITGCHNNCPYCYARRFANRLKGRTGYPVDEPFRPTFHPDKLQDIYNLRGAGKRVFLDSMGDWFSPGVDPAWIDATIEAVRSKPEHTFLVLTKRPASIDLEHIPPNLWLGASVTCQNDAWRIEALLEGVLDDTKIFVSFEPLHGPISCDLSGIDWVIIGAESGNGKGKIKTEFEWLEQLTNAALSAGIPVFHKENLIKTVDSPVDFVFRQQFPGEMTC